MSQSTRPKKASDAGDAKLPAPPEKYRQFTSATVGDDVDVEGGVGLTLDEVVERWQGVYRRWWEVNESEIDRGHHEGKSRADLVEGWNDIAVWEADRVAAVLKPEPTGRAELLVTRFDAPQAPPGPTLRCPVDGSRRDPQAFVYDHAPKPGHEGDPVTSFRVVNERGMLESIHEGRGLTAADVAPIYVDLLKDNDTERREPHDLVIMRSQQVEAIVRVFGGGYLTYGVLPIEAPFVALVAGHEKARAPKALKRKAGKGGGR